MFLRKRNSAVLALLMVLSACTTTPDFDVPSQPPAKVEDRNVVDGEVSSPLPDQPVVQSEPMTQPRAMSPVVRKLVASAQTQQRAGNWDGAASSLERALRIEPRNALLWARLADVHFGQKAWRKAIQIAAKSNTLAKTDTMLRRQNWYLMANAYDELGDVISAQKYRSKLNR